MKIKLVTIAHSHFCESGRWMLQLLNDKMDGIQVEEAVYTMVPSGCWGETASKIRAMEMPNSATHLQRYKESVPGTYFYPSNIKDDIKNEVDKKEKNRMDTTMTPVAIVKNGTDDSIVLLGDSHEIVDFVCYQIGIKSLTPSLRRKFDIYGTACRNLYYYHSALKYENTMSRDEMINFMSLHYFTCIGDGNDATSDKGIESSIFFTEKRDLLDDTFDGMTAKYNGLSIMEEKSLQEIDEMFQYVEKHLQNHEYLGGDQPSGDDYIFAALSSLIIYPIMPSNVKGLCFLHDETVFDALPPKFKARSTQYRNRVAGKHVLKMYRLHRNCHIDKSGKYHQIIEPATDAFLSGNKNYSNASSKM